MAVQLPPYEMLVAALQAQDPGAVPGPEVAEQLVRAVAGADAPDLRALRVAVRWLAQTLAARAPGRTVELRVPPYAAVQCVPGPRHTRGTPPNVVEVDPVAFVGLCVGALAWPDGVADGRVRASGERAGAVARELPLL